MYDLPYCFLPRFKNNQDYQNWVSTLKSGDLCLLQEFVPRNSPLYGYTRECWKFTEATFIDKITVKYQRDIHPMKNGDIIYWSSDLKWGEVFHARIIPFNKNIVGKVFSSPAHCPELPIYSSYILYPFGDAMKYFLPESFKLIKHFKHVYSYNASDARITKVFTHDIGELKNFIQPFHGQYMYSEETC